MKWFIQDSTSFASLAANTLPMISALNAVNADWQSIGLATNPFTITGLNEQDHTSPSMFFGGTTLVSIISKLPQYQPGVFYKDEWFDPRYAAANNPACMLNTNTDTVSIGQLRTSWPTQAKFIKPINVKVLTGMVIEPEESYLLTKEYAHVNDNELVMISDVQKIEQEWRFFIVDNKIVAGSSYKRFGVSARRVPLTPIVWAKAAELAASWLPNSEIVMDMALLWDGTYKIVEYNSVNSSGGYNCDWTKIFGALASKFDK